MGKGKLRLYKGKEYYLAELLTFCAEGVTRTILTQRLCTSNMTVEEAVDTPKIMQKDRAKGVRKPRTRANVSAVHNNIMTKVYVLFWAKTSTKLSDMRYC